MSFVLPSDLVRHIVDGPLGEARVAVNALPGGDPNWPSLVIVVNAHGVAELLEIMMLAIEHAPDAETKAAWKGLALQTTSAIQGAITS